ncbi:MAG: NAD(P)/FAD-dependent oxidoreductase [bacterium]
MDNMKSAVIVGAGPAGVATAIQLSRYGVRPVLLEKGEVGGLLKNANMVENYPGFPEGIRGLELVELFKRQLRKSGVEVSFEEVTWMEYIDTSFIIKTTDREIVSDTAVIASGTKPRSASGIHISKEIQHRVLREIHMIRGLGNRKIVIVGAGDAAFDYALSMSEKNEVAILNRSDRIRCVPALMERCMESGNISYLPHMRVERIESRGDKAALTCTRTDTGKRGEVLADYAVIAIGRYPCMDFLGSRLKTHLQTLEGKGKLYMVGDVKRGIYRQVAVCVGDGVRAAMGICRDIAGWAGEDNR